MHAGERAVFNIPMPTLVLHSNAWDRVKWVPREFPMAIPVLQLSDLLFACGLGWAQGLGWAALVRKVDDPTKVPLQDMDDQAMPETNVHRDRLG